MTTRPAPDPALNRHAKYIDGRLYVSTSVLCEWLGVTDQTLLNWEKDGCPGREIRGFWYAPDVWAWRGEGAGESGEKSVKLQKLTAETARTAAQAAQQEIKLGEMQGLYLKRDVVSQDLRRIFGTIKRSLLTLGRQVGIELSVMDADTAATAEVVVNGVVRNCLEQLAISGRYKAPKG